MPSYVYLLFTFSFPWVQGSLTDDRRISTVPHWDNHFAPVCLHMWSILCCYVLHPASGPLWIVQARVKSTFPLWWLGDFHGHCCHCSVRYHVHPHVGERLVPARLHACTIDLVTTATCLKHPGFRLLTSTFYISTLNSMQNGLLLENDRKGEAMLSWKCQAGGDRWLRIHPMR
jgi:hypothetical protein